ncbi:SgcJ/EcaC family oxidoreductase [Psychrobacillus sp. FJAT-51614]|uniref:SgcJ/EcaC family oxidoreductase n=1 Tax=Psychrobacillus mangrovi TaxID=3117745 RepID=A0ABU8F6N3_9BACI
MEITDIEALYKRLIDAWNIADAREMSDLFSLDGVMIGYDGSLEVGRENMFAHLLPVFESHRTAKFVTKVKEVSFLNDDTALLRSIAGMIPPGKSKINPAVNTHHTLVVEFKAGKWQIRLFQNTPALFHGRPELVDQMTKELEEILNT